MADCSASYLIRYSGVFKLLDKISSVIQKRVVNGIVPNQLGIVPVGENPEIFETSLIREEVLQPHRTGCSIPPRPVWMPSKTGNRDNAKFGIRKS